MLRGMFIHGLFARSANFYHLNKTLTLLGRYNNRAIPLAGHRDGTKVESMDWDTMTYDLKEHVRENRPDFLVGSSYGGKLLLNMKLSGYYTDLPFVLLDVVPIKYKFSNALQIAQYMNTHKDLADIELLPCDEMKNLVRGNYGSGIWHCQSDLIEKHIKEISNKPPTKVIHKLESPVLVLKGANSAYIPKAHKLENFCDSYNIVSVPAAGHFVHIDNPEFCAQQIHNFMDTVIHAGSCRLPSSSRRI